MTLLSPREGSIITAGTDDGYSCPTLIWLWYLTIFTESQNVLLEDTHKDHQVQLLLLMSDRLRANPLQTGQITCWFVLGLLWQAEQGSYDLHCGVSTSTGLPRNKRRSRGLPTPGDRTCVLETESRELELVWWREVWRGDQTNSWTTVVELFSAGAVDIRRSNKMNSARSIVDLRKSFSTHVAKT